MSLLSRYFTIGMAGHIDHGKTTLTKVLTGVNTDHLKEEQERNISIEPGFAPFIDEENLNVSLIDVPGHESFIRQMIAGVAGIDFVMLVIAADEGIMPQTREHLAILSLLGINKGFVVLTKMDQADSELLELVLEDINSTLSDTFLEEVPLFKVDSLSEKGIPELRHSLRTEFMKMTKVKTNISFRLPVDHAFTVKGQGVIARGTIYNGDVSKGDRLKLLPSGKQVRVRQIQTHGKQVESAQEGQRAALNLGGITLEDVARGDVLVEDDFFIVSDRIDIAFDSIPALNHPIKQRQLVKLHSGTTEVMGKIIFFDRNEVSKHHTSEILCQLQLDEKIVVTRGDRFILRRSTPVETIGGGWVMDPNAKKHRFGKQTIEGLKLKQIGTTEDRVVALLIEKSLLTKKEILKQAAIDELAFNEVSSRLREIENTYFTLDTVFDLTKKRIIDRVRTFHDIWTMRSGINKAELISELKAHEPTLLLKNALECSERENEINVNGQYISLADFAPSLPSKWENKLAHVEDILINQGAETAKWSELSDSQNIPGDIQKDYYYFLLQSERAFVFDEERIISKKAVNEMKYLLIEETKQQAFSLQTARDALQLSRKNLVPLLELMDRLGYTKREGNTRTWVTS